MRRRIGGSFEETNSGDGSADIRTKLHTHFDRERLVIKVCRGQRAKIVTAAGVFVRLNVAGVATPVTVAVTLSLPAMLFADGTGDDAIRALFVLTVTEVEPPNSLSSILKLLDEEALCKALFIHHAQREQNRLFPRLNAYTTKGTARKH